MELSFFLWLGIAFFFAIHMRILFISKLNTFTVYFVPVIFVCLVVSAFCCLDLFYIFLFICLQSMRSMWDWSGAKIHLWVVGKKYEWKTKWSSSILTQASYPVWLQECRFGCRTASVPRYTWLLALLLCHLSKRRLKALTALCVRLLEVSLCYPANDGLWQETKLAC